MPTIKWYYDFYRAQGYSATASRSMARRQRAEEVARTATQRETYEQEYQRAKQAIAQEQAEQNAQDIDQADHEYTYDYLVWTDAKVPTNTMFPHRPRSNYAHYDEPHQTIAIRWARPSRNPELGPVTYYRKVPRQVWETMKEADSTGQFVNRVLNFYDYDYRDEVR